MLGYFLVVNLTSVALLLVVWVVYRPVDADRDRALGN